MALFNYTLEPKDEAYGSTNDGFFYVHKFPSLLTKICQGDLWVLFCIDDYVFPAINHYCPTSFFPPDSMLGLGKAFALRNDGVADFFPGFAPAGFCAITGGGGGAFGNCGTACCGVDGVTDGSLANKGLGQIWDRR